MNSNYFCISPSSLTQYFSSPEALSRQCYQLLLDQPDFYQVDPLLYLKLFALTCTLELPFYGFLFRRQQKLSWPLIFGAVFILNIATHPAVCYLWPWIAEQLHWSRAELILISEIFAPLVEAVICWRLFRLPWPSALVMALLANLFSWWFGIFVLVGFDAF